MRAAGRVWGDVIIYRGYIFDLDGTLYRGERVISGAPYTVAELRRRGCKVVFISNKPLQTRKDYAAKLTRLGIPATPKDIISSSYVLGRYLAREAPGARLYVIAEPPLLEELQGFGLVVTDGRGPVDFVATNADRTCPVEGGEIPDAAAVIGAIEGCTGKEVELVAGKPSSMIIEVGLERLSVEPADCLVVGDRLETDIVMGKRAGTATALVLTGVTRREDLAGALLQPDYILESVRELIN